MFRNSDDAMPIDGLFDDQLGEFDLYTGTSDFFPLNPEFSSPLPQEGSASKKRPREMVEELEDHPAKKRRTTVEKETKDDTHTKKITEQLKLIAKLNAKIKRLEKQMENNRRSFEAEKSSLQTQLSAAKALPPTKPPQPHSKAASENKTLRILLKSYLDSLSALEAENVSLKKQLDEQTEIIRTLKTEKESTQPSQSLPVRQTYRLIYSPHLFSSSTLTSSASPTAEGEYPYYGYT